MTTIGCTCGSTLSWNPGEGTKSGDQYTAYARRLRFEGDVETVEYHFIGSAVHPVTAMPIYLPEDGFWEVFMTATRLVDGKWIPENPPHSESAKIQIAAPAY